ncbi:MAG: T9SS type A sorting domain-containing protein, partial [Bacteroidaceae bacterium]|nr:T9SS type A sorting domain-containing protein [Bacteroidaceae bacterium]
DGVEPITNNNVIITHNKSTNNLKLLFTKETINADIKIYDITGKAIYSKNISRVTSGEESLIDTSTYKKGIYIIRVIGECSAITNKFIVP